MSHILDAHIRLIFEASNEARARGALSLWTVYDHPKDYPNNFVARRFETGNGNPAPIATTDVVVGSLDMIRRSMQRCGLVPLMRNEGDHATIVETWI